MSKDKYMGTWRGPRRDTEKEALEDIKLLNAILEEHAPDLYAYATSTYGKDRPVPGAEEMRKKRKGG